MNRIILAIDTCTELCSAALWINGNLDGLAKEAPREHSQQLLPMVQTLLERHNLKLTDIDGLAFGRGPGSFTGIRICTSMAQGLSLGANLPCQGVSTLAAMAQQALQVHQVQQVVCAIDARMGEVYFGHYRLQNGQLQQVSKEVVATPEQILQQVSLDSAPAIAVGTGFESYPQLLQLAPALTLSDQVRFPDAKAIASIAASSDEWHSCESIEPVYLRNTVTWKKLPGRE
ncbi:tRNA (adenosine(37)-N6)-threonylcarbamoyltransferase complex dimerization subunit type 1 TsaB [Paraferrimonas haliotis]|uniref:tRNA threonylcarbamoyladenosine biosynthesis protein TsaB n=2 Tax=Paraferrimonas haliotis TaxID=2013866 RepID=A0AA37TPS3_9GAMM|nr:tRNA (adenosine(37)-N6)-threonylcarbamoyltransferase complex dimerization subunit type 1 TsaB [Paraferrimonas haliotis]